MMEKQTPRAKARKSVYIRVVLYSLLSSITAYIHSSYLISAGLTQSQIDSIYYMLSVSGIIGVWLLALKRRSIASFAKIIVILAIILCCSLAIINWTISPALLIPAIFLFLGIESPMFFVLDELLEHVTEDNRTANTRSLYLVLQNCSWIIAPFIGFILVHKSANLDIAYLAGLVLAILLVSYSVYSLSHTRQEQITTVVANKPFNAHVLPAIYAHFALYLFYAFMISIMPIFMHDKLGWSWATIGATIALALCAFPLVQIPLGKFLDKHHYEKRIMPIALIIMSVSLFIFVEYRSASNILVPIIAFFFTRVGAAALEVSNESYIFRHINYTHRTTIALFRSLSPLSFLFVPLYWIIISLSNTESLIITISTFLLLSSLFVIALFGFRNYLTHKT